MFGRPVFNLAATLIDRRNHNSIRLTAAFILVAIRDGIDLFVCETDPDPNVIGVKVGSRYGMIWQEQTPFPHAELPHIFEGLLPYFRQTFELPSGRTGILPICIDRPYGEVVVIERISACARSVTYQVPLLPEFHFAAKEVIDHVSNETGLIEFENMKW